MTTLSRRGFTLIELMIAVAIIGILAAVAITNFQRFQARAKTSEVKANLRALFTAQKAHYAAKDTYSPYSTVIGFSPERGNRYTYWVAGAGMPEPRNSAANSVGVYTGVSADTFRYGPETGISAAMQTMTNYAGVISGAGGSFLATAATQLDTMKCRTSGASARRRGSTASRSSCRGATPRHGMATAT